MSKPIPWSKNSPGKDYGPQPQTFPAEITITLIDGEERKLNLKIVAMNENDAIAQMLAQIRQAAQSGVLSVNQATGEFTLDPVPSQIKNIKAKFSPIVLAPGLPS